MTAADATWSILTGHHLSSQVLHVAPPLRADDWVIAGMICNGACGRAIAHLHAFVDRHL